MASKHTNDQDYELKLVQALCWSRSFETETILIHVNPGGPRKEGFMGGSGIWAPLKGKIGGYEKEEVGIEFVDVDLGVIKVCFESPCLVCGADTDFAGWKGVVQDSGRCG
jgi:hypothetical protein